MIVNPLDGLGDVAGHFVDGEVRHEAVIDRDEDVTPCDESCWFALHASLIASPPAAAMNPNGNGMVRAVRRRIHIQTPLSVGGIGVGDVPLDPHF